MELHTFNNAKYNSKNLWEVPSFKHRHFIKRLAKPFYEIPDFAGTTIAILLKTGEKAWLSSTPKTTLKIISAGLHRGDLLLDNKYLNVNRVIFPEDFIEIDEMQSKINAFCNQDTMYRAYCISRSCGDCSILVTCNVTTESINYRAFYRDTIDLLENKVHVFLNKTMGIYSQLLPGFSNCQFSVDANYRRNVINRRHLSKKLINLNNAELDVLYWSAQGKTAQEIAAFTGLTKNTINTYRQRLTEKLDAMNITQAVYIASKAGYIV
ncbi:MAG: helix-turn-helix transcriptional regulator [Legionellaceae bacterium]|nr:helix-turn-helix transcriptional regulator [Legionellaceae bacterium]